MDISQKIQKLYEQTGISPEVHDFGEKIEKSLKERFDKIDKMAELNQLKVIHAMQEARVNAECFNYASGYGYNDFGRDTLEKVYANVFHTEDALVRPQITCGTHALALTLSANLRPGDELLSIAGKPYDTLEEVIGIRPSTGVPKDIRQDRVFLWIKLGKQLHLSRRSNRKSSVWWITAMVNS